MSESDDTPPEPASPDESVEVDIDVQVSEGGGAPRRGRPRTRRPRSSKDASTDTSHSSHIELASLQMAKARQEKIKEALLEQVRSCEAEIQQLEHQIQAQLDELGLTRENDDENSSERADGDGDSFTHEY